MSEGDQALIVATMERIVLALGARGLVNAQFIVRDDGVYLIEVNPRASRTVPFMSKVTGVPMVELAVRISLGATLPELGWDGGHLAPPDVRGGQGSGILDGQAARGGPVGRAPGCSRRARSSASPTDPRVALAKALLGAALVPPRPGADGALALLSIADRDKESLPRLAGALAAAGYRLAATPGTRRALAAAGYDARPVAKLGEEAREADGEVAILDLIASGEVRLVVNTPDPALRGGPRRGRDPPGRHRGGDPVPDGDGDGGCRRGGARSGRSPPAWVRCGRWRHGSRSPAMARAAAPA